MDSIFVLLLTNLYCVVEIRDNVRKYLKIRIFLHYLALNTC